MVVLNTCLQHIAPLRNSITPRYCVALLDAAMVQKWALSSVRSNVLFLAVCLPIGNKEIRQQ